MRQKEIGDSVGVVGRDKLPGRRPEPGDNVGVLGRDKPPFVVLVLLIACGSSHTPTATPSPGVEQASRPPATPEVLRGERLLAKGQLEEAQVALEEAVENDPQDPRAWLDLGLLYEEMGDPRRAEKAYRRSSEIDENFAEPYNNLGVLLRERGQLADAIPMLERAAALDPRLGPARFNLALAYEDAGERDKAESEYLAAIQALQNDPVPRINLAMLYLDTDRPDEAADQLRAAAPWVRQDVLLSIAVGGALRRAGAPEEAVEVLHGALKQAPDPPPTELLAELALALYATDAVPAAEKTMRSAVNQSPKDPALQYALGAILVKRGKLDEARRHLQRVVKLDPDGPYAARARAQLRSISP